jgi:hypothetical protein
MKNRSWRIGAMPVEIVPFDLRQKKSEIAKPFLDDAIDGGIIDLVVSVNENVPGTGHGKQERKAASADDAGFGQHHKNAFVVSGLSKSFLGYDDFPNIKACFESNLEIPLGDISQIRRALVLIERSQLAGQCLEPCDTLCNNNRFSFYGFHQMIFPSQ